MTYIVKNTEILPLYDQYSQRDKEFGCYGVPFIHLDRTPIQMILVDYVGLENFSFHLYEYKTEMMELYQALLKNYRKKVMLIAGGPGRFVRVPENFTAETMGPGRFAEFHVPVYRECFPILQNAGKVVGTHFDGQLFCCSQLISDSPIDLIESLTPPPEGDMTLLECRQAWPDKLFWVNINVSAYNLPEKELRNYVSELVEQAAVDGKMLAFEISEHLPRNWQESVPVVLNVLNEL